MSDNARQPTVGQIPAAGFQDVNPDPARYQMRPQPTFTSDTCEILGLSESWWEPRETNDDGDAGDDGTKPLSLPRDLLGYQPLRLWFGLPHPAREMNDDWFEVLFSTLYELTEDMCAAVFGGGGEHTVSPSLSPSLSPPKTPQGPWADPALSPSFVYYANDVARKGARHDDGGWDALLADPRQRAFVAQGVLAKVLDEHVFAALLFGGTASQQEALGQWDRIMLKEEGYKRKFKRCEEVQYFLGGRVVTPHFWAEVDRVTAQTAQLLLPLVNLQRAAMAGSPPVSSKPRPRPPGLPIFYQRLHDIVALAGYASLCMAWSTSIFQIEFPEPGQPWQVDQEREGDEHVYAVSEARAQRFGVGQDAKDGQDVGQGLGLGIVHGMTRAEKEATYLHAARIKIVLWPRIARYKPLWDTSRTALRSATRTVLTKSHNAYYFGGRVRGRGGAGADDNTADTDAADAADEDWPDLHEHVAVVRAACRRANKLWWARWMGAAWLVASLVAWTAGMAFLAGQFADRPATRPQSGESHVGIGPLVRLLVAPLMSQR